MRARDLFGAAALVAAFGYAWRSVSRHRSEVHFVLFEPCECDGEGCDVCDGSGEVTFEWDDEPAGDPTDPRG